MTTKGTAKIAAALVDIPGKTVDRVFIVHHPDRFQLLIAFDDDTYYEFYGDGELSGARCLDRGNVAAIREILTSQGGEVLEAGERAV